MGLNQTIQEIQERIDDVYLGDFPISYVTISFDPQYDSPDIIHAYADSLGADTSP